MMVEIVLQILIEMAVSITLKNSVITGFEGIGKGGHRAA